MREANAAQILRGFGECRFAHGYVGRKTCFLHLLILFYRRHKCIAGNENRTGSCSAAAVFGLVGIRHDHMDVFNISFQKVCRHGCQRRGAALTDIYQTAANVKTAVFPLPHGYFRIVGNLLT